MSLARQARAETLGDYIRREANTISQLGLVLGFVHPAWVDIVSWKLYSRRNPREVLACTVTQPIESLERVGGLMLRLAGQSLYLPDTPQGPGDDACLDSLDGLDALGELGLLHRALEDRPQHVRLAGISAITARRPMAQAMMPLRSGAPPYAF